MTSVGETLRQARVGQGLTLEEVATRTKIQLRYLTAIERDQTDSLPGSFFYRSFVHQYGSLLGLDTGEIDHALDSALGTLAPPPTQPEARPISVRPLTSIDGPNSRPHPWLWSIAFLGLVLLGCSGLYMWYSRSVQADGRIASSHSNNPAPSPAPSAPAEVPGEKPSTAAEVPPPVAAIPPSAPAPVNPDEPIQLSITATEETWVSLTADGKRVFAGTLQANQTKQVGGREFAKITVGNAGGLSVQFNGRPVGSLGAHGQVRVVLFSPDKFEFVEQQPSKT